MSRTEDHTALTEEDQQRFDMLRAHARKAGGLVLVSVRNKVTNLFEPWVCIHRTKRVNGEMMHHIAPIARLERGNPLDSLDLEGAKRA